MKPMKVTLGYQSAAVGLLLALLLPLSAGVAAQITQPQAKQASPPEKSERDLAKPKQSSRWDVDGIKIAEPQDGGYLLTLEEGKAYGSAVNPSKYGFGPATILRLKYSDLDGGGALKVQIECFTKTAEFLVLPGTRKPPEVEFTEDSKAIEIKVGEVVSPLNSTNAVSTIRVKFWIANGSRSVLIKEAKLID